MQFLDSVWAGRDLSSRARAACYSLHLAYGSVPFYSYVCLLTCPLIHSLTNRLALRKRTSRSARGSSRPTKYKCMSRRRGLPHQPARARRSRTRERAPRMCTSSSTRAPPHRDLPHHRARARRSKTQHQERAPRTRTSTSARGIWLPSTCRYSHQPRRGLCAEVGNREVSLPLMSAYSGSWRRLERLYDLQ